MNHKARWLPSLIISALCSQCATSGTVLRLSETPPVAMECFYTGPNILKGKSEIECLLENRRSIPARIQFKTASFDEPGATIIPVNIGRLRRSQTFETIGKVLVVILIVGVVVALVANSKSTYMPNFRLPMPDSSSTPPRQRLAVTDGVQRDVFPYAIELPGKGSALLILAARHGLRRPRTLLLDLEGATGTIQIPIRSRFHERGRSEL